MRNTLALTFAAGALATVAGTTTPVRAGETINFVTLNGGTAVNTGGLGASTTASTRTVSPILFTYSFANTFSWAGSVTSVGTLRQVTAGNFASESRIAVTTPANGTSGGPGAGTTVDIQPTTTTSFSGTLAANRTQTLTGFTPVITGGIAMNAQTFTFRFYESYNDGGTATDAQWDALSVTFNDFAPPPPPPAPPASAVNLGTINAATFATGAIVRDKQNIPAGGVAWWKFTVAAAYAGTATDLWTQFSTIVGTAGNTVGDTVMGVYDAAGTLLFQNDDYNFPIAPWSHEGFSNGTAYDPDGPAGDPAFNAASAAQGRNALALTAQTYYVGVVGYSGSGAPFGAFWTVSTPSTNGGSVILNIVPAPGTLALLGLGGLFAGRRRRS